MNAEDTGIVMIDAHAHIGSQDPEAAAREIQYRRRQRILTVFNAADPDEWQFLSSLLKPEYISFGIHPWKSDRWDPSEWKELYRQCRWIGEIGMDTLWCDIPETLQQNVFLAQLETAAEMKKPVVLHTKNCESRIADMLRDFSCTVLVHWYSGTKEDLKRFLDLGCIFTLGPDTGIRHRSRQENLLLSYVPADRILTETDGIDAIEWAYEETGLEKPEYRSALDIIPDTLHASADSFGRQFGMSREEAEEQICRNFRMIG